MLMAGKKKILVVDDEENITILIKNILEPEGFDVSAAGSGKECIKILSKEKPDLVLLDVMMPEITGVETAWKIRSNPKTKNIKIILLTVVRMGELNQDILKKLKISDHITKPFDNAELVKRVKKALG